MVSWEILHFADEKLPRATAEHDGFRCICEPDEKHEGKYGYNVFGSDGDWQSDDYRLIVLYEYWSDSSFKGLDTIEQAQNACIEAVNRYRAGRLKPTVMERGQNKAQEINASGVKLRTVKSRKRKKT